MGQRFNIEIKNNEYCTVLGTWCSNSETVIKNKIAKNVVRNGTEAVSEKKLEKCRIDGLTNGETIIRRKIKEKKSYSFLLFICFIFLFQKQE